MVDRTSARRPRLTRRLPVATLVACLALAGAVLGPRQGPARPRVRLVAVRHLAFPLRWAASLSVRMPADEPSAPDLSPTCPAPRPGWVRAENERPGSPDWFVDPLDEMPNVEGYVGQQSVRCGDLVTVHLSGTGPVVVRAYRMGYYHGIGARLVWTSPPVEAVRRSGARPRGSTRVVNERWPVSLAVRVTTAWPPGLYLLELSSAAPHPRRVAGPAVVPLVVRDPAGREPVVVDLSSTTWAAYDPWGGASLYGGERRGLRGRAFEAGLLRPLVGRGLAQLLQFDVPLVRLAERTGVDVAYVTDLDVDASPRLLLAHREVVLPGHSEYWSRRMLDGVLAARNAGVDLASFGGDELGWQVRVDRDRAGTPVGVVCWRTTADPEMRTDPALATLSFWADPGPAVDVGALLGERYTGLGVRTALRVGRLPPWLARASGLRAGSVLVDAATGEVDGITTEPGLPPDLAVLAQGTFLDGTGALRSVETTYYTAPSGAAVFDAGSTDWSCQAAGACLGQAVPPAVSRPLAELTLAVLRAFARPRFGATHPSVVQPPMPASQLAFLVPPGVASAGDSEDEPPVGHDSTEPERASRGPVGSAHGTSVRSG
jgi:hypothetical protein